MSDKNTKLTMIELVKRDLKTHRGAFTRLALYMIIAFSTDLLSRLGSLTDEIVNSMRWWSWTVLFGQPAIAAFLIWRSFLDSSMADSKGVQKTLDVNGKVVDSPVAQTTTITTTETTTP